MCESPNPEACALPSRLTGRHLEESSGRWGALQKLEFVPPRVEVRDLVSRRFQLRLQIENLRARFRIKIRRGKRGLQIRYLVFCRENIRLHGHPFTLFFPLKLPRFVFAFPGLSGGSGRRGV